jgi:deazaflavin-dependent oxidoreductase (nitroreductase family)
MKMSDRIDGDSGALEAHGGFPGWMPVFNAVAKPLLAAGVPLGPNGLLTVRGRKSGLPRTTPVAIIEASGRRWIWSPFGEEQWVRNLRVAGQASITKRRRKEEVSATELDPAQRVGFFRDVLGPLARGVPFGVRFIRMADKFDLDHPVEEEARGRVVFELRRVPTSATSTSSRTSGSTPDEFDAP